VSEDPRYGIGELADLGGVSRRTVRYYVQQELLPPPLGVGRGNHYTRRHLDQLLHVKALQEAGRTLDEIREVLNGGPRRLKLGDIGTAGRDRTLERTLWRRVTLAAGLELQVSGDLRLPSPGKLQELAAWCRQHFVAVNQKEKEEESDD
jgi:DNA-binding transcriptional MerR regulator